MTTRQTRVGAGRTAGEGKVRGGRRCSRCGVPLTADNASRRSGYCDPCHAQIEGEIRNQRPL